MTWPMSSANGIDALIAFTLLEGLWLAWHHRRNGEGVRPRDFAVNMASGICLMLALRGAIAHSGGWWISAAVIAAGLTHATDLVLRWQRRPSRRRAEPRPTTEAAS